MQNVPYKSTPIFNHNKLVNFYTYYTFIFRHYRDLIYVTLNKTPNDFEFISHTWTLELLAEYIKLNQIIELVGALWELPLYLRKMPLTRV